MAVLLRAVDHLLNRINVLGYAKPRICRDAFCHGDTRPRGICAVTAVCKNMWPKQEVFMSERQLHGGSNSGLTEAEAREFHGYYMTGLIGFTAIAVVAHILTWLWRPWFGG
jgi:light-harvesting complex 1 beta chain